MGYVVGLDKREADQVHNIAQASKEQFDLGIEDLLAGRFEFAKQRFEFVLSLDPQHPGAAELLGQAMQALNQPTPTPSPVVSPTPSPTTDFTSYDGVFQSALGASNQGDWSATLDFLLFLRGEAPTYKLQEVNQLMQTALRNRGLDKLFQGQLEEGIFDLYLAERFGPLDSQALSWRRSAEFFMFANSYFELDWPLATEYFGQICLADIWGACARYAQSAREVGHLLLEEEAYCRAVLQYEQFFIHLEDQVFAPTATKVAEACMTATAPTPTPTQTPTPTATPTTTPGTETPEGTFTPTPSSTITPSPSVSATSTSTIEGPTFTPTSTPTATQSATPTPSPTWTPTPSPAPS
jgi:tetratricopeptide (TPR) repeat protein